MSVKMTIKFKGKQKKGSVKLNRYNQKLQGGTERGMRLAGALLQKQMVEFVTGPSKTVDPSRKYPGVVTHKLRPSIKFIVDPQGKNILLQVGPNVFYAIFLEHGTSRMKPLPFVFPTWDKKKKDALRVIQKTIMKPLKGRA